MRLANISAAAGRLMPGARLASHLRAITASRRENLPADHYQRYVDGFGLYNKMTENKFVDRLQGGVLREAAGYLCVSGAAFCQLVLWTACAPLLACKVGLSRARGGKVEMERQVTRHFIPLSAGLFVLDVLLFAALLVLACKMLR